MGPLTTRRVARLAAAGPPRVAISQLHRNFRHERPGQSVRTPWAGPSDSVNSFLASLLDLWGKGLSALQMIVGGGGAGGRRGDRSGSLFGAVLGPMTEMAASFGAMLPRPPGGRGAACRRRSGRGLAGRGYVTRDGAGLHAGRREHDALLARPGRAACALSGEPDAGGSRSRDGASRVPRRQIAACSQMSCVPSCARSAMQPH